MDSSAVVLKQTLRVSSSCYSASPSKELRTFSKSVMVGRRRPGPGILSSGFCDQDGFGLDSDVALLDQVKGNMISEAAELLLEQLQKLRADEKKLKRKMKEEKARLKAANKQSAHMDCEMSSSSSSESSDSECGEVIDMNDLKRANAKQSVVQKVIEEATSLCPTPVMPLESNVSEARLVVPVFPSVTIPEESQLSSSYNVENECCSGTSSSFMNTGNLVEENVSSPSCSKKIEVCMGGKCKKSGAGALLEEFQRVVGIEGAVTGCKCMGKCRDGPNVKVLNGFDGGVADGDAAVRAPANSLCIGVGLEDVNMIVANFLGENHNQLSFAAAS
ncbi:Diacylglycerol O-acyltransferase 3 [Sesamum angolense]|uniref:Diacylglycerol O-acyltransferase 3 n=1 Tax=Sesamum angolense TaxID=2727404 RepID=A0AAE1W4C4_9LAMI|nr:Diacylglycerol O-acyltransferase 3 [Sesamum angolense]